MNATFKDYGYAVGMSQRGAEQTGHTLHIKYMQATEQQQTQARRDFCVNYLVGKYGYTHAKADYIASIKTAERSDDDKRAYNNAQSNFNYRIVNDSGNVVVANHKEAKPVPRALKSALKGLIDQGFTASDIRNALKGM